MRSGVYDTSPLIPEALIKRKYLDDLLSTREIVDEFSCSKTCVRSLLLMYGIPLREPNKYHKDHWRVYGKRRVGGKAVDHQRELRTVAAIKRMYAEGMSTAAIARTLSTMQTPTKRQGKGWDHSTVTAILKREGVYGLCCITPFLFSPSPLSAFFIFSNSLVRSLAFLERKVC